jgi:hypothetical protein
MRGLRSDMEYQTSFQKAIDAVFSNDITFGFSAAIMLVFLLAAISHVGRTSDKGSFSRTAPSILTSIGVLGTFLGIFLGLLDFDVARIDTSVPLLLEGLKVAFVTSIMGMFFAIIFKVFVSLSPKKQQSDDIGASDIHNVLVEMRDSEGAALEQIRKAISDESDSSLVTQLQKMRAALGDGQGELKEAISMGFNNLGTQFSDFAETMAENSTKALVDALQSVIRDFNTQLNEQFGDNFKQLNEAVAALLTWQEQYKEQVEEMGEQFDRSLAGIKGAELALSEISASTAAIPQEMESLTQVMTMLDAQLEDMDQHLEAFAQLKEDASAAFPLIEEKLELMTSGVGETVSRFTDAMEESLSAQEDAVADLTQGFDGLKDQTSSAVSQVSSAIESASQQMANNVQQSLDQQSSAMESAVSDLTQNFDGLKEETSNAMNQVSDAIENASQQIANNVQQSLEQQSSAMENAVGQMHEGFKKAVEDSNEVLGKQIAELDQQMQDEVKRVVEVMGGHLASLSAKFVDDYTPLTEKLRDVIKIAEAA